MPSVPKVENVPLTMDYAADHPFDLLLLADMIAFHMYHHHRDDWKVFCQITGSARRDRLMQITDRVVEVARQEFGRKFKEKK